MHDYGVRLKAAQKFLKDGDKVFIKFYNIVYNHVIGLNINFLVIFQVKLIVSLKGRENDLKSHAIELIRRFRDDIGEVGHMLSDKTIIIIFLFHVFVRV